MEGEISPGCFSLKKLVQFKKRAKIQVDWLNVSKIPLKLFWNTLEDFEQTRIFGIFPPKSLVTLTTDELIAKEFGSRTKYDPGPAQQKKDVCVCFLRSLSRSSKSKSKPTVFLIDYEWIISSSKTLWLNARLHLLPLSHYLSEQTKKKYLRFYYSKWENGLEMTAFLHFWQHAKKSEKERKMKNPELLRSVSAAQVTNSFLKLPFFAPIFHNKNFTTFLKCRERLWNSTKVTVKP